MCSTGGILYDKTGANSIDHIVSIVGWGVSFWLYTKVSMAL